MATATDRKQDHSSEESYIILHTGVDGWSQGQVVPRDAFRHRDRDGKETHDTFERLSSLGAIRPATEHEARMGRGITAPGFTTLSAADQMRIATIEAELDRLRRVVGDQQDRIASYERLGLHAGPEAPAQAAPEVQAMLEEKQAELEALRSVADDNQARLEELGKKARDRRREGAEAAEEGRGSVPFATGTAAPVSPGKAVEQGKQHDREAGRTEGAQQAPPPPKPNLNPPEVKPGPTAGQAHKGGGKKE